MVLDKVINCAKCGVIHVCLIWCSTRWSIARIVLWFMCVWYGARQGDQLREVCCDSCVFDMVLDKVINCAKCCDSCVFDMVLDKVIGNANCFVIHVCLISHWFVKIEKMCEMWGWCVQQRQNWEWNIDEYDIVFMVHMCYDSGNSLKMVYNVVVKLLWCKIITKPTFFRFEPIFGSSTGGKLPRIHKNTTEITHKYHWFSKHSYCPIHRFIEKLFPPSPQFSPWVFHFSERLKVI